MKRYRVIGLLLATMVSCGVGMGGTVSPKREFRALWIATVSQIDWPHGNATNAGAVAIQKQQLCAILDDVKAGNLNAVMLQVRPTADAFYQSSYEPWSQHLTGVRGQYPGYDPLQFAIEECHKRGIELHAWVNPFRYEVKKNSYGNVDIRANHPDWLLYYNNTGSFVGTILDPGQPVVRQYVCNVMMEMVNNYDVDGMIWDDYFYPYGGTTVEDSTSQRLYKPTTMNAGDWRRQNVNQMVQMIYDSIQAVKPWVRFGMAPFGIWTTQSAVAASYGITLPKGITGLDDYSAQFCDPVAWIQGGYVDYISPQLYWPTTQTKQSYTVLSQWWSDITKYFSDQLPSNRRVHFYSSNNDYSDWVTVSEEATQVRLNRQFAPYDAPGAIFYNTSNYRSKGLVGGMQSTVFQNKALPPAMDWKENVSGNLQVDSLKLQNGILTWSFPDSTARFTIYVYPKGVDPQWSVSARFLHGIVWGNSLNLSGLTNLDSTTVLVSYLDRFAVEHQPVAFNKADVELIDSIDVHVTGISMRLKETKLRVGETIRLNPTVVPSSATVKTVLWSSSNDAAAMVSDEGVVTGVQNGEAIITGKTLDGGYEVHCTITVFGGSGLDANAETNMRRLIMVNGQLFILRGEDLYTIDGKRVK